MTKELELLEKIKQFTKPTNALIKYDNGEQQAFYYHTLGELFPKEFDAIETALKRNIELEEENKILTTIRDNFDLYIEPNYRATLQFQQCCTMTQSEYEKFIKYFGEPRDE